jgi:hypothetical protein
MGPVTLIGRESARSRCTMLAGDIVSRVAMPVKRAVVAADGSGAHELACFGVAMNLALTVRRILPGRSRDSPGPPWLTIIYPTPGMKSVRAVDKGLTGEMYGKAKNTGLIPNDGYREASGLILIRSTRNSSPATQTVMKRRGLWSRSLKVWRGKESRADDFGQKTGKTRNCLGCVAGKGLSVMRSRLHD